MNLISCMFDNLNKVAPTKASPAPVESIDITGIFFTSFFLLLLDINVPLFPSVTATIRAPM